MRKLTADVAAQLARAEATLAGVKDDEVKLPLHIGLIRWDINGDGKIEDDEQAWRLQAAYTLRHDLSVAIQSEGTDNFVITFDYADLLRLRGDCHLMLGMCEVMLAHDWSPAYLVVAPYVFATVESPAAPEQVFARYDLIGQSQSQLWTQLVCDALALIHQMEFKLEEPKRLTAALKHFEEAVALTQKSLAALQKETDDDHEWIAGPKQTAALPDYKLDESELKPAADALAQLADLLAGKRLLGHWRIKPSHGIDVRLAFTQPRDLSVPLWMHGRSAVPYLKEGKSIDFNPRTLEHLYPELTPGYVVILRLASQQGGEMFRRFGR
jgi:hypothetical protein